MSKLTHPVRLIRTVTAIGLLALGMAGMASAAAPRTLVDLVREGKRDSVLAAITSPDVDVNVKAPDGSTSLMWATFNVDHELVDALIKAGAKANVTNNYGATALTEAMKLGDMRLFHTLLEAGADVESPNMDNQTALMLAISLGSDEMAKELIERGANVKAIETFRDQTPLMWAAGGNMPEIVDLLLAKGAAKQVNLKARYDDWARMMTSEPRAQYGSRQTGGLTALLYATRSGCYPCAVSMVKAGADINLPNPDGVTPLINALDNRNFDIAMFLLDQGANPHVWDRHGRTAVYVAVDRHQAGGGGGFGGPGRGGPGGPGGPGGFGGFGGPDRPPVASSGPAVTADQVLTRLLDMGVDTNHQLNQKRPYGPGRGRFQDYDIRDGVGPLFIAAMNHDHAAMKALLAHGAEVDLPNIFQMTPLMMAVGMRATGRAGGGGGPGAGGPGGDASARTIESIDLLLDAGANVNAQIIGSHTRSGTILAYVAGRDQEGKTALMAAAEGGQTAVVQHLLERGADPTIKDATGKTALDFTRPAAGGPGAPPAAGGRGALASMLEAAMAKAGASAN